MVSTLAIAQRQPNNRMQGPPPGGEKIRAIKIGMITQELRLTESQAEKFWPIYNNFSDERGEVHKEIRRLTKRPDENLSNNETLKRQDRILELQQQEIDITKKYRDSFLKVITPQQYGSLMATERKFNQMLLEKLKERQGQD